MKKKNTFVLGLVDIDVGLGLGLGLGVGDWTCLLCHEWSSSTGIG